MDDTEIVPSCMSCLWGRKKLNKTKNTLCVVTDDANKTCIRGLVGNTGNCIAKSFGRWALHPRGFPSELLKILQETIFRDITIILRTGICLYGISCLNILF